MIFGSLLLKIIYANILKLKSLFLCLKALILGNTGPILKTILVINNPAIDEGIGDSIILRTKREEYKKTCRNGEQDSF